MSGIAHGAKITPISYIFGEERKTLPLPDVDPEQLGGLLSSAKAKLVKDIIQKQQVLKRDFNTPLDAYILFLGHVYVVRAANATCEKITGDKARALKKQLSH